MGFNFPATTSTTEMPLLTGDKVGTVGSAFPKFIQEAPKLQITSKNNLNLIFTLK